MSTFIRYMIASTCVVASLVSFHAARAQEGRNVVLAPKQTKVGSKPYQQAVDSFFSGQQPKIVGGDKARADAFPWQVSLGVSWIADPYRGHFCGGSIYSSSWIVTAAHCLRGNQPEDVIVTAGTHILGSGDVRRNVRRIIIKSDYSPATSDNDIALLELWEPLPVGGNIKPIEPLKAEEEANVLKEDKPDLAQKASRLMVVGWGATQMGGTSVRDLRYVDIPFIGRETCNRPLAYDNAITTNMICAGELAGGKDSCQGDSGGPLTANTSTAPRLAGVVSWGEGCAKPNKVGVYTRVANYVKWIEQCVANPEACK